MSSSDLQISLLMRAFPSARRVAAGDEKAIFEIIFDVNGGLKTLRIYLSHDFPTSPPKMQVVGALTHPWIDAYSRVNGCPTLYSWNRNTSTLDEVVQDILVGLQVGITTSSAMNPPPPSYDEAMDISSSLPELSGPSSSSPGPNKQRDSLSVPSIPHEFPELANLSEAQLQRLLDDDVAFQAHVSRISEVDAMISLRDLQRASNKSLAEAAVAREQELKDLRNAVVAKQELLRERVKQFVIDSDTTTSKFLMPRENIISQLNIERAEKDRAAEELADAFHQGKVDLDTFLRDYIRDKTQYYAIAAKIASSS